MRIPSALALALLFGATVAGADEGDSTAVRTASRPRPRVAAPT